MNGVPSTPWGGGLASRLLGALTVVVLTGGLTAWLVAAAIGPALFHQHMVQAGVGETEEAAIHAEEAFRSASALSLAFALVAALIASTALSLLLTRRIGRSLDALTAAAAHLGRGRYDSRVPRPGLGSEFDELAETFNRMAVRLEESEDLRRRLLADVAHELRTPVATLTAYLEGIEDGVATLTPETSAVLRNQGSRLTRLADDLAAVTRAESHEHPLDLVEVSPGELLATAARSASDRFTAAGVQLVMECGDDVPRIPMDRDRMAQVLGNLVDNALRHTSPGGAVTLRAEARGRAVRLVVSDTGEGIGAEHLTHVFERFYRVDTARDRASGGSGIGLAITRALVEAHGGTITAHSDGLGAGSRFEIVLPAP